MTGRERVTAAIAFKEVDHVPLGFYAVDHDTIEAVIGRPTLVRNKVETQIALWEGRRDELAESFKKDSVEFYRKIDCADIILPKEAAMLPPKDYTPNPPKQIEPDVWEDARGRIYKASREANEIACVHDPNPPKADWSVDDFPIPDEVPPLDESTFEAFDYLCEQLGDERYLCSFMGGTTAMPHFGSFGDTMMLYADSPEIVHAANRASVIRQNTHDAQALRPGVAGAHMSSDMAGSNGPFISPAMWRELCFPYFKERVEHIKQHVDQVNLHNCGMNIPLMDMFIEAGVDCYQSLQTTAGMEVGRLKEMFGERIAFWGGVAVEKLILGTPGDVREEVRTAMQRGAPGGGFILGPSHSIAKNTKYENLMAMLDEYMKLRDTF